MILIVVSSDFQIREPNALPLTHTYTVMCVLPINLFNQVGEHRSEDKFPHLIEFLLANIYFTVVLVCHCHRLHCL